MPHFMLTPHPVAETITWGDAGVIRKFTKGLLTYGCRSGSLTGLRISTFSMWVPEGRV